jgi:putative transposase
MPRAHRHFLPGHIWHITHRCHKKQFLLKFAADRRRWTHWLYEARKRFGLCVLDYVVTSNHVHLLVRDRGRHEIPQSMQLVAGRTAQEYNRRKNRRGAFWEDRYHATAVDADEHIARCLVYIDLNMVRAGMVSHPRQWSAGGYQEIQHPRKRRRIVDLSALMDSLSMNTLQQLQRTHAEWISEAIATRHLEREGSWSESLAVGSRNFVDGVKQALGMRSRHRRVEGVGAMHRLREPQVAYRA